MQHNDFHDDDDDDLWDNLDESDFEQCILKETEFLTQNPSAQKKVIKRELSATEDTPHLNHWIDGNSSSFDNGLLKPVPKLLMKNVSGEKPFGKGKSNMCGSSSFVTGNSSSVCKKQNFYKPLNIGLSSVISSASCKTSDQVARKYNVETEDTSDLNSLQGQLDQVLQEKTKLEEENLVKQGEVLNIRCELKRKDAALEAERIDHCLALEAAEKRGKDKSTKLVTDADLKIKTLEKELDRLQGNLMFKGREVDELLLRCKRIDSQASFSCTQDISVAGEVSPSSKRKRLELKGSPSKTVSSFANRFDFGYTRRSSKNVLTQTECESKAKTRTTIRLNSPRGHCTTSRKVYHLLSSHDMMGSLPISGTDTVEWGLSLLAQLISPQGHSQVGSQGHSQVGSIGSQEELVKAAHTLLHRLVNEVNAKGNFSSDGRSNLQEGKYVVGSYIPPLSIVAVAHSTSDQIRQESLRILALCLQAFLKVNVNHKTEVLVVLESLAVVAHQCSQLCPDICDAVILSFKECCETSSDKIILKFLVVFILFIRFENFKKKICITKPDECLLRKICGLFQCTGTLLRAKEITNHMVILVACLLYGTDLLVMSRDCDCSSFLLSTFINHLLHTAQLLSEDAHWHPVISGVKVLHLWQCKDRAWWEKAPQLHSYTAFLSLVVRKSKYLRERGVLDQHTWELIFDLYDVEEPALS